MSQPQLVQTPGDVDTAIKATQMGEAIILRELLSSKRVGPSQVDADGCSLLHWAAINNRIEIAAFLLQEGAPVNYAGGILGETPLQWAIRKRAIRMVCMLLEKDADIHHKDVEGLDALGLAVKFGYVELAFIFLWKGADANTQDAQGRTLLLTVCSSVPTNVDMVRLLLKFGAKTELNNPSVEGGKEPLHMCVLSRAPFRASWTLLEAGASIITKDAGGYTPIGIALAQGDMLYARFLFEALCSRFLPENFVAVIPALMLWSACLLIELYGWAWGLAYWIVTILLIWSPVSLATLPPSTKLGACGFAFGAICLHIFLFHFYFTPYLSAMGFSIAAMAHVGVCVMFANAITTLPQYVQQDNGRANLVAEILTKQPIEEGPTALTHPPVKICTTCLTDKSLASIHCSQCDRCVINLDHHCPFVNNCIGVGNRRMFLAFLLSAIFAIGEYIVVAYNLTGTVSYSEGWVMTSRTVLKSFPALAISNVLATILWVWIASLFGTQLYLVGVGKTTFDMIQGDCAAHAHESTSCMKAFRTAVHNIIYFFQTGKELRSHSRDHHNTSDTQMEPLLLDAEEHTLAIESSRPGYTQTYTRKPVCTTV